MSESAQIRYNRGDYGGASNTFYNIIRRLKGNYDLKQIKSIKGTFEQAKNYYAEGNILQCLSVLKYIETEVLYGRYNF